MINLNSIFFPLAVSLQNLLFALLKTTAKVKWFGPHLPLFGSASQFGLEKRRGLEANKKSSQGQVKTKKAEGSAIEQRSSEKVLIQAAKQQLNDSVRTKKLH